MTTFTFQNYHFEPTTKTLDLNYSYGDITFKETICFNFEFATDVNEAALDRAFKSLWIMAGISYHKAHMASNVVIKGVDLSEAQANFFGNIYQQGLGEFFHDNDLNPKTTINFPYKKSVQNLEPSPLNLSGSLVPLGGGKDSLTTIDLLQRSNHDFETITVDSDSRFQAVSEIIGKPHLEIKRTISPELIRLNQEGAMNGHVPISAIWGFIFVCTALLRGKQYIVLSNEHSANAPTMNYQGTDINHQYSKTLEFEQALQNYIHEYITPEVTYFSFLRPLSELAIARHFTQHVADKYEGHFSSCNRNFHIAKGDKSQFKWCGKCPKCAFVFTIFAPFMKPEKLITIFGENLFEKPELAETFRQLTGQTDSKPFECVGEVEEVLWSLEQAKANYPAAEALLPKEYDLTGYRPFETHPALIPASFKAELQ